MKRLYVLFLSIMLCVISCVRDVVLDAEEKPVVVVECILNTSNVQELRLNFTKGASKEKSESITEAVVTLIDLTGNHSVGQFEKQEGDLWILDYSAQPAHRYRLEVQVPGYDLIYAEETMPYKVKFWCGEVSSTSTWISKPDYHDVIDFNKIRRKYPEKSGQFVFVRGSIYMLEDVPNPFILYGMNYNPVTGQHEFVEQICTDHPSVLPITLNGGTYVPPSIIEDLPWVQLHPYLEGAPLHNRYMIFPRGAHLTEKYFVVSGSFSGDWADNFSVIDIPSPRGYIVFASISDHYKSYLEDAIHIQNLKESTDMSSIYIRDNIYSNINGGLGLFGAIVEEKAEWNMSYMNLRTWEKFWSDYEKDPDQFYDWDGRWWFRVNDKDGLYEWYESGKITGWEYWRLIG